MPNQPIGYVEPTGGKLALGLADPLSLAPTLDAVTPNATLTASWIGGTVFTGFGQARTAASSAPLLGLNSVGGGAT